MYTISKQFSFSASHQLDHLPEDHPCSRLHGHNYEVEVIIKSPELDWRGFAQVDYAELDEFELFLKLRLDHRHLNDVFENWVDKRTTAENLARYLYENALSCCRHVEAVRVSETPRTWAEYRPNE